MAEIILNEENFETEALNSDIPVLIDFFATWCGPCRMLAPTVEEIAEEYDGKIKVCKVDVDEAPALAVKFGISVIPTLVILKNGEVTDKSTGVLPKEKILEMIF